MKTNTDTQSTETETNGGEVSNSKNGVVSERQIKIMEHALGNERMYRNYFLASEGHSDWKYLQELVALGFMVKQDAPSYSCGSHYFAVNDYGKRLCFR